jgi:hypothetical protein
MSKRLKMNFLERQSLLHQAANDFGFEDIDEMFANAVCDSLVAAICPECGYTTDMEPNQDQGWCEMCEKNTVVSVLVLGGLI